MSRRIDGVSSDDQQPTDLIPQITSDTADTAAMPVVDTSGYYRPEPGERVPASHRRERSRPSAVRVGVFAGALGLLLASAAVIVLTAREGGAAREQARPTATASQPHFAVTAPPTTRPPAAPLPQRRKPASAIPVPATTSKRPTVTPRASVSASPHPPKPSPTATPRTTPMVPSLTPGASGVTNHSSKETPCPA